MLPFKCEDEKEVNRMCEQDKTYKTTTQMFLNVRLQIDISMNQILAMQSREADQNQTGIDR